MTQSDFEYIKDAFSQIIDDIAGNPDWYDATRAIASDIGTLEKLLEKRVVVLPEDLEEEVEKCLSKHHMLAVGKRDFAEIARHFAQWGAEHLKK